MASHERSSTCRPAPPGPDAASGAWAGAVGAPGPSQRRAQTARGGPSVGGRGGRSVLPSTTGKGGREVSDTLTPTLFTESLQEFLNKCFYVCLLYALRTISGEFNSCSFGFYKQFSPVSLRSGPLEVLTLFLEVEFPAGLLCLHYCHCCRMNENPVPLGCLETRVSISRVQPVSTIIMS